jgi:hypothetical protein
VSCLQHHGLKSDAQGLYSSWACRIQEVKATGHVYSLAWHWHVSPPTVKDPPDGLRESDADISTWQDLTRLVCSSAGRLREQSLLVSKAVKRGALVYRYYSQDMRRFILVNPLHHHAMRCRPRHPGMPTHILLAELQMTSPASSIAIAAAEARSLRLINGLPGFALSRTARHHRHTKNGGCELTTAAILYFPHARVGIRTKQPSIFSRTMEQTVFFQASSP